MKREISLSIMAVVSLCAGCVMFADAPVTVDPRAVIASGSGCPGCHGTTLRCARLEHPKRKWTPAERALEKIIVPEVDFRDCPLADACMVLSEQTGVVITDARTNQSASASVTVTSEMRQKSLLFVLEWMALGQHCNVNVTAKSATFIDGETTEPNTASQGTARKLAAPGR